MKFDLLVPTCVEGRFVPAPFAGPKEIIKVIQLAEHLGYDAVWGTDFITPVKSMSIPDKEPPNWYEVLISLAYAAAVTKHIKLGTGVILLPYRDPVILAKQAATLDQFSGGRLLLGIGLGGFREEFEAIRPRERKAHRGKMMDEQLEALQLLLSHQNKEVGFKGEYVEFQGVKLNPQPVQNPLPMYTPGRTPEAVERVARWGLGYMIRASAVHERLDVLRPALEKYGRDLSEIDVVAEGRLMSLAPTHEAAVESYRNSRLAHTYLSEDINKLVSANWIGTPGEVVQKIVKVKKQGVSHFVVLHIARDTLEETIEQMQVFAEEVIPPCKSA